MTDRVHQVHALEEILGRISHIRGGYGPPSRWFGVTLRADEVVALTDLCEELLLAMSDEEILQLTELQGVEPKELASRMRKSIQGIIAKVERERKR